jgi:SAM-dependent methyltransferase
MNSSHDTITAYDQYANVYDAEVIDFWNQFPQTTIEAFCSRLPGKHVLNLGSGSGRDAAILRDRGLMVTCLDASRSMVHLTRQQGFKSIQATFADMDLPANTYDGIWAYTSLIHVPPKEARSGIVKAIRALKPHGIFLIGVIIGDNDGMVERKSMPGAHRYFKQYTKPELTKLMSGLGLKLEFEEDYQPHNTVYLSQVYTRTTP